MVFDFKASANEKCDCSIYGVVLIKKRGVSILKFVVGYAFGIFVGFFLASALVASKE